MNKIAIIYTSIDSQEAAQKLATKAVARKHAVCVNIIPGVLSIYAWKEMVEHTTEWLMIFKTDTSHIVDLRDMIQKEHPYSTPAILEGVVNTSSEYFDFVNTYNTISKTKSDE